MNVLGENGVPEARLAFGESIRALRKEKGLSQSELAKQTDLSQAHISKIEQGKTAVSVDLAGRLAEIVGNAIREVSISFNKILDAERRIIVQQIVELSQGLSVNDLKALRALAFRLADGRTREKYLRARREEQTRDRDEARRVKSIALNLAEGMADRDRQKTTRPGERAIRRTR